MVVVSSPTAPLLTPTTSARRWRLALKQIPPLPIPCISRTLRKAHTKTLFVSMAWAVLAHLGVTDKVEFVQPLTWYLCLRISARFRSGPKCYHKLAAVKSRGKPYAP